MTFSTLSLQATRSVANGVATSFAPALLIATAVFLTELTRLNLHTTTKVLLQHVLTREGVARIPSASISTGVEPAPTPGKSRDSGQVDTLQALEALNMAIFEDSLGDDLPPATSTGEGPDFASPNGSLTLEDNSDDAHAPTTATEDVSQSTTSPVMVQRNSYEALCSRSPCDMIKFRQWRSVHMQRMQHPTYGVIDICPDHSRVCDTSDVWHNEAKPGVDDQLASRPSRQRGWIHRCRCSC